MRILRRRQKTRLNRKRQKDVRKGRGGSRGKNWRKKTTKMGTRQKKNKYGKFSKSK